MEAIISYFKSMDLDLIPYLIAAGVLLIGSILLSAIGRFVFGKKSTLSISVSSAIGIIFIYLVVALLHLAGPELQQLIAPLPFATIQDHTLHFSAFQGHYAQICSEILSMIVFAFLVNLADQWLPRGKNLFTWLFFRILTVLLGYLMHWIVVYLFNNYLPQGLVVYAPTVLLAILILLLLTGALKLVVGAVLSVSMGPIIGGLYTFFFANLIGKMVTRAVLTTAIISGLVYLLNYLGVSALSFASTALIAYIPFLIILLVLWYLVHKIF